MSPTGSPTGTIPLQTFALSITLQAPYLVHGNDAGRYGLHATLLRNHRRIPVLPGTLLAGRIAEVWTAHGKALGDADADRWFGTPGITIASGVGQRARLRVSDLVLTTVGGKPFDPTAATHEFDASRVQIDDTTGSVQHGALLMVEQVCLPGASLTFQGEWSVRADDRQAETLRRQLQVALQMQTQLGAWRNIGFGRVQAVEVKRKASDGVTRWPVQREAWAGGRRRFALTSDDALCLSASTQRGNVFVSVDHVSGGTIKGVLARMLSERYGVKSLDALPAQKLACHFDKVRVTHALPAAHDSGRPVPLPQSLVSLGGGQIRDAFRHEAPPDMLSGAVAFQTDWKTADFETAGARQGKGRSESYLRVRTDINGEGQAKDGALFAYDCRVSARDEQGHPLTRWLFDIDLGAVPEQDRGSVAQSLDDMLAEGLAPLGKTDARMEVQPCDDGAVWPSGPAQGLKKGDKVPVLLVTDALLFPTTEIEPPAVVDLVTIYTTQFEALQREIVGAAAADVPLRYSHHFATQRLAGGRFLHERYRERKDQPYRPLVLTEAGSVFVFEVVEPDGARRVLEAWQRHGLKLPPEVQQCHGADWTRHPYLPENGHGEVAVHPQHGFQPL
ncbi:hypothetical protein X805_35690 [Sphaerotilus natans subsp. natans DSM 6575]|uniref:CRISPR type III-associated protein domain-containing protein n=1 Tax=Sphaerotilus natans subsp. natans DSM 6575 TaxID=1286631 RepID=A0A059KHG7_9BURK|nr:RAMP superfamily CRISPR-associated protein [Sphaerotilus natans]KDB50825.1 hypothetical protein X805_35690 [Sphaerotilus natans subsp. natans DSM 6575]SIR98102.1 hypothetical protein SAMN05421778_12530 [Sphaerotilus natans]